MNKRRTGLSEDELDRLAERITKRLPAESCAIGIDPKAFDEERRFIRSLMDIATKVDSIRWGVLGTIIKGIVFVIIGMFGMGLLVWAKAKLNIQ